MQKYKVNHHQPLYPKGIQSDIFKQILQSHNKKFFKKGSLIYDPSNELDGFYYINEGCVKITLLLESGRKVIKEILEETEILGLDYLFNFQMESGTAIAAENTIVSSISVEEVKKYMTNADFSLFLLNIYREKLNRAQRLNYLTVHSNSRTRIIDFLLFLAQKKGQRIGYETLIRLFLTHQEIGDLTSTGRQTVTTILNELKRKNILVFNRKRILIRDLDLLKNEI